MASASAAKTPRVTAGNQRVRVPLAIVVVQRAHERVLLATALLGGVPHELALQGPEPPSD
eukprot:4624310-Pyramimonas_sp.AAC.1